MSFVDAHGAPCTDREKRRFNGARSYKARKLAGAISEVREKYATEAQSRGSDAFHARPPEFRGILEFFSDIFRGSCFSSQPPSSLPTYPCSYRPTARGFCAKERVLNTLTRCLMYVYVSIAEVPPSYVPTIHLYLRTPESRMRPESSAFREKCVAVSLSSS